MLSRDTYQAKSGLLACCRMDVQVAAKPFDLVNYTVDLDEASCGIMLSAAEVAFATSVLLNLPAPRRVLAGYSLMSVKRQALSSSLWGVMWSPFGHPQEKVTGRPDCEIGMQALQYPNSPV